MSTTLVTEERRTLADLKHDLRALLDYYAVGRAMNDLDVMRFARTEIASVEREIARLRHPELGR